MIDVHLISINKVCSDDVMNVSILKSLLGISNDNVC